MTQRKPLGSGAAFNMFSVMYHVYRIFHYRKTEKKVNPVRSCLIHRQLSIRKIIFVATAL